ncbi:heme ABC transporter ATP-binding protein [Acidovorax sp. JMULE5]|uniref:heme ABC transporter ATP-binding protein n=1 Tax=Acidovorax sp. JMULE5 TaxID=2518343 RepID=UPI0015A25A5F|nr:heme ABC transporter ATP-binding protein [Acidovorax sp. JMULE5]QLA80673.1 heme ABC transporter ATP-binding protein [Acidovorax sp. JMULE5]
MSAAVASPVTTTADLLVCDQLVVGVPGRPLLATVHTQFVPGRVTAILGPNGAGKSTLLAMLSGQRAPRSGHVWMGGQPVSGKGAQALARQRAVLPQDTAVAFDFTVKEVVEMGRFPHRQQPSRHEARIVTEAMQATGVAHLAGRSINTLSGGERARSHLARALAQIWEPLPGSPDCPDGATRWLLLDEPTAALDLAHQHHTLALVRRWAVEQGVGVVAVLHDLNLALRYAHDSLLLAPGLAGPRSVHATAHLLTPATIAQVWGVHSTPVLAADGVPQYLVAAR